MRNKIVNKQIPISSIIDVANYLEKYKEDLINGNIEVGFDGEQEFIDNGFEL